MIAFDEEIISSLNVLLEHSPWRKVDKINERSTTLIKLHNRFINLFRYKLSAEDIAQRLYLYDQHTINYQGKNGK